MFTKEQHKKINTDFWDKFRSHMKQIKSSNGRKMNWTNYPTDVSYLYVRMELTSSYAQLCFDSQSKDPGIREIIWDQLEELKTVMELNVGSDAVWIKNHSSSAIPQFDRIYWRLDDVNYYKIENQDKIISFFAEKLIGFDNFYQEFKDILVNLAE